MKTLYKAIFFMLFMCWQALPAHTQDVGFSQYYDQPFQRNPALAGIFTGDIRVVGSFRNQWQSVTVPYQTFGISGELKLPMDFITGDNVTVGLQMVRDVAGTSRYSTTQAMPALNYSFPLSQESNSFLSVGVMGGWRQQKFDPEKLTLNDQFVPMSNGTFIILPGSRQVFTHSVASYFDISAGISYNGTVRDADYYIGAGMFHLVNPGVRFVNDTIQLYKKLTFNFGLSAPLGENDELEIYGDFFRQYDDKYRKIGIKSIQAGLMFNHILSFSEEEQKSITVGMLYRLDDAIIPVVKLELNSFVVGVSYDVNISKLVAASNHRGGIELALSYKKGFNYRNGELRQTICPRFGRRSFY
jgi:type IX secretion system PorP/SprF family membrane protein